MVGVYMVLHGLNIKERGFHGDFVVISGVFTVTNLGVHHKKVCFLVQLVAAGEAKWLYVDMVI